VGSGQEPREGGGPEEAGQECSWCRGPESRLLVDSAVGRSLQAGQLKTGRALVPGASPSLAHAPRREALCDFAAAAAAGPWSTETGSACSLWQPWSCRVACFPPWWSWVTLSLWLLCGTGAGGVGRRRMSKVSTLASAVVIGHYLCQEAWGGTGVEGPPPSPPTVFSCALLFLPLH
jgi:hypothetical protein